MGVAIETTPGILMLNKKSFHIAEKRSERGRGRKIIHHRREKKRREKRERAEKGRDVIRVESIWT